MRTWMICAAVGALTLAGCSGGERSDGGSPASTGGPPGTSAATATASSATGVYVVQEAGRATLTVDGAAGDGLATLVLSEAQPRSVYFTGSPSPRAGTAPNQDVIEVLNAAGGSHEAALSWSSPTDEGTLIVTVVSGRYDEAAGALTYQVRPLDASAARSAAVAARASASSATGSAAPATTAPSTRATLPADVAASTLFIDPLGQDQAEASCNLTVVNNTPWPGTIASINRADSGGMTDWDTPFTDGQKVDAGQRITASSGNSAWDCHARVGVQFTDPIGDDYEVYITLRDPVFSKTTWNCQGPPELGCDVTANAKGQPLDMTVTIST